MRLPLLPFLLLLPLFLASCYISDQGFAYLGLLGKARSLDKVLADPGTAEATRELVRRTEAVEAFGRTSLGLKSTRNFHTLVELQSDTLVHVVQACAELSFDRYLWDYPFIGKLPYKGFFDTKGAEAEAARLKKEGLDVIVRNADAFSTLGWLSDPLWSFMSSYEESDLADLVLHELTHATAFRSGSDDWNEGIATFVGREGARQWLVSKYGQASPQVTGLSAAHSDAAAFASFLRETAEELEALYSSGSPDGEKRSGKKRILAERAAAYTAGYQGLFATDRYKAVRMENINNAWLDLYRLYEGDPALYRAWFERIDTGNLQEFIADMAGLAKTKEDPRAAMQKRLSATSP
ncbi:MAG: aminopeptidase [Spirochaetota bacterium]